MSLNVLNEDWRNGGFGLYVHWPFCMAKCPYCDFNSHVVRDVDQSAWADAFGHEINRTARQTGGRVLNSIFFGGGTPSLMDPSTVETVIETARSVWSFANDIEITLEANPTSVEATRFAGYRAAGVNRVSLGVQALNDTDLKRLGRTHSVAEALAALDVARHAFDRVSFDLIYARQDQTRDDWQTELEAALGLGTDHLSLYQLSIEPETAFGDRYKAGGLRGLPDEDLSADLYELTQDICESHGLPAYEVSNHAAPGSESRHNLIYWRYGDYVGIGPGAHGRVTLNGQRFATETLRLPHAWLEAASSDATVERRTPLAGLEQAEEYLMMGLRVIGGISIPRYETLSGRPLDPIALRNLEESGLILSDGSNLTVSKQGLIVLNAVILELLSA